MLDRLKKFHTTKPGLLIFGLLELALVYTFISLAIDRGNFLYYLLTLIFLVVSLQNLVKLIRTFFHE